jgi:hypothetical protein
LFEQPFINIYKEATGQVNDPQGNDVPLNWQDFYGAALSVMATYQMTKAVTVDVNMSRETMAAVDNFGKKAAGKQGKAYKLNKDISDNKPYFSEGEPEITSKTSKGHLLTVFLL